MSTLPSHCSFTAQGECGSSLAIHWISGLIILRNKSMISVAQIPAAIFSCNYWGGKLSYCVENGDWMYPTFQIQISLENALYNIGICCFYKIDKLHKCWNIIFISLINLWKLGSFYSVEICNRVFSFIFVLCAFPFYLVFNLLYVCSHYRNRI